MIIRRSITYGVVSSVILSVLIFWGIYQLSRGDSLGMILVLVGIVLVTTTYVGGIKNKTPRVIMDNEGISATEFHVNKIYWKDVKAVKMIRYPHAGRIITFELFDESKYMENSSSAQDHTTSFNLNRLLGLTRFCIMVEGLDMPARRIYQEITAHIVSRPSEDSQFSNVPTDCKFTVQKLDSNSGLIYNRQRNH